MTTLHDYLVGHDACSPAVDWVGERTLKQAWAECERGDWLLWLAGRLGFDRRALVQATCDCARLALPYASGDVPLHTIETAEAWCRGEATLKQVRAASADAAKAAWASVSDAAWAADAAAAAASSAVDAACAASWAADAAADASVSASASRASAQARAQTLAQCADLVRARIPLKEIARLYEVAT